MKTSRKALIECAKKSEIDIESFIDFSSASFYEKIDKQEQLSQQAKNQIKGKYDAWQHSIEEAKLKKKSSIKLETLKNKITSILHNNVTKTCFIPEYSYYKNPIAVSYTHLDVYKRQSLYTVSRILQSVHCK